MSYCFEIYASILSSICDQFVVTFFFQEDIKSLITYVVETHFKAFENVEYVETFKKLKQRFDQHQDVPSDRTNLDR